MTDEVKRLAAVASALRSKQNSLSKQIATRSNEGLRQLISLRETGDVQDLLLRIDDDINVANTIAQLREIFLTFDNNHNDKMEVAEFKQACEWLSISAPDAKLQSSFRRIDTNHDGFISENEFIAHVLGSSRVISGSYDLDRFEPLSQVDALLTEVNRVRRDYERIKVTGGNNSELQRECETLRHENASLRKATEEMREEMNLRLRNMEHLQGQNLETDLERMQSLLTDMEIVQGNVRAAQSQEVERELARLREFGTAMRNQVNSMQKEAVLLTRHLAKLVMQLTGAADDELQVFDNYTETVEVITQVRQAFINLDDAHMGDMDFDKYVQAFQFLHVNASQDEMRKSFDKIDTNGSGYIDESEFLASMVPDVNINDYTLRNQLMVLENKLEALVSELESLQGIIDDATKENVDADR
jgi:Ca2+-binding EF-hand superfamily protein